MRFVETIEGDHGYNIDIYFDPQYQGYSIQLVRNGVEMKGYSAFEDTYTEAYKTARDLLEIMEKEARK